MLAHVFRWSKEEFAFPVQIADNEFTTPDEMKTPLEYFQMFFSDDLFELILQNTNLYSAQKRGDSSNISVNDLRDFLAIELLMGIVEMPAYTDYWSEKLRYSRIADIMPLKRYQMIRRFLHFVDNDNIDDDRYFKIRPVMEIIRKNCIKIEYEKRQSIDEMMIPYKGTRAGTRRQYIKNKPKKWGYKMFVRAGVSGIVYDFLIYAGADTFSGHKFTDVEDTMGFGSKVVLALCDSIKEKAGVAIYFDNFFSSLELLTYLRLEYGILSLGTFRANRLRGCTFITDKELQKQGRGSFEQMVDNNEKVALVKWADNKAVLLGSSFVAAQPVEKIKRYNKEQKSKIDVTCPQIVKQYNAHMGGVDLADMLIAIHRTGFKTHRWYMGIFSQLLDLCVNNGWLMYRRDKSMLKNKAKQSTLKEFRYDIAISLNMQGRVKRGRPSLSGMDKENKRVYASTLPKPIDNIRFDNTGHFPIFGKKGRCRHCSSGQTSFICSKCEVRLCLVPERNCFTNFHQHK